MPNLFHISFPIILRWLLGLGRNFHSGQNLSKFSTTGLNLKSSSLPFLDFEGRDDYISIIYQKLGAYKDVLKLLIKKKKENATLGKQAREEIFVLQRALDSNPNGGDTQVLRDLRLKANHLGSVEESEAKKKCRLQWHKKGDDKTKFFFIA